jgi:hypothetical protein
MSDGPDTNPSDWQHDGAERNGDSIEVEVPAITAPTFPHETTLNNSHTFFQRTVGGGMLLKFVPLVTLPNGQQLPDPHATCVMFSPEGWEQFRRQVAADGIESRIVTARSFPEGFLRGEG